MKQIDYETAIHMMAFEGRTDIRIMVREVEPVDIHTLYALQKDGQVMFFIQEDPLSNPADKSNTPPNTNSGKGAKKSLIDKGKIQALHQAGWSVQKIADEMKLGQSTIYKYIKDLK